MIKVCYLLGNTTDPDGTGALTVSIGERRKGIGRNFSYGFGKG